ASVRAAERGNEGTREIDHRLAGKVYVLPGEIVPDPVARLVRAFLVEAETRLADHLLQDEEPAELVRRNRVVRLLALLEILVPAPRLQRQVEADEMQVRRYLRLEHRELDVGIVQVGRRARAVLVVEDQLVLPITRSPARCLRINDRVGITLQ